MSDAWIDDQQSAADYDAERRDAWLDDQPRPPYYHSREDSDPDVISCGECGEDKLRDELCDTPRCGSTDDTADVVWGVR